MALMPLIHSDEELPEDDPIYDRTYLVFRKRHAPGEGNFVRPTSDGRWGVVYKDAQGHIEEPPQGYVLDTRREAEGLAGLLNLNERNFGRTPPSDDNSA
jgi:hypothetical protein